MGLFGPFLMVRLILYSLALLAGYAMLAHAACCHWLTSMAQSFLGASCRAQSAT
jgi:hypothetical protein